MSKASRIVILCEDRAHELFAKRFLTKESLFLIAYTLLPLKSILFVPKNIPSAFELFLTNKKSS